MPRDRGRGAVNPEEIGPSFWLRRHHELRQELPRGIRQDPISHTAAKSGRALRQPNEVLNFCIVGADIPGLG